MKKLILLATFLLSIGLQAQKIKGVVYNSETKLPVKRAHIQVNKEVYVTNKKGEFSFRAPKKWNKEMFISHLSYKNQKLSYAGEKEYKIYIKPENTILDEVSVVGEKGKRKLEFEKLPALPKRLHSFASVLIDDKIYVFGGDTSEEEKAFRRLTQNNIVIGSQQQEQQNLSNPNAVMNSFISGLSRNQSYFQFSDALYTYDLQNKNWTEEEIKVRKRANHSAVKIDDKIYILGGKRLSTNKRKEYLDEKVEVFNPISKKIEVDDTNPHQSVGVQTITYKGKMFTFGGSVKKKINGDKYYSQKVHSYDPKTGLWHLLAEIPIAEETSVSLIGDKVYFIGGFKKEKTNMIVSLNLANGKMKAEGKLFYDFSKPSVTKKDKTIYIFENSKLLTYNTETNELRDYRIDLPFYSSQIFVQKNDLLVLGGYKKDDFGTRAQQNFFKIDLAQLPKTRARKYAKL